MSCGHDADRYFQQRAVESKLPLTTTRLRNRRSAAQLAATIDDAPLVMMRVLVEPVLPPDGGRGAGRRQLDTGASAVIAGRGGGRIWQRDDESIEVHGES